MPGSHRLVVMSLKKQNFKTAIQATKVEMDMYEVISYQPLLLTREDEV